MSNKKYITDSREYDELVKKFVAGEISFEEFVNSTPPIPPPRKKQR